jgi:hypothetical protein
MGFTQIFDEAIRHLAPAISFVYTVRISKIGGNDVLRACF